MAEFGSRIPEIEEAVARQDEFVAAMALAAYVKLEQGDMDSAKQRLAGTISIYYRGHRHDGNTDLLGNIERYAITNSALPNAIYGKLD
jgi:hypothetical protein